MIPIGTQLGRWGDINSTWRIEVARMPVRRRGKGLERWEVALIKAMMADRGKWPNDQDILAYFTRPSRSLNHRTISEIRTGAKHSSVRPAPPEELEIFL